MPSASIEQRPTGDDTSVLFLETPQELSRARLQTLLKQAGIEAQIVAAGQEAAKSTTRELLLETQTVSSAPSDPRLDALLAAAGDGVLRAVVVGGYANPLGQCKRTRTRERHDPDTQTRHSRHRALCGRPRRRAGRLARLQAVVQ